MPATLARGRHSLYGLRSAWATQHENGFQKSQRRGRRKKKEKDIENGKKWFSVTDIRLNISLFVVHPILRSLGVMSASTHQTHCIGIKERRVCRALAANLGLSRFLLRMASHGHYTYLQSPGLRQPWKASWNLLSRATLVPDSKVSGHALVLLILILRF